MLWYKAWLETRWRFLIGIAILMLSVVGTVFAYPRVERVLPLVPSVDTSSLVGQRIKAIADLSRTYGGYIWAQWLRQNNVQMLSLFAALLGTGGLLSQATGGGGLFTLSLPVSRDRLFGVRAATGLTELAILAFVPSLLLPLLSPSVGQTFGVGAALAYGACAFVASTVLFSATSLLSTVFNDIWRPLGIAVGIACVVGVAEGLLGLKGVFHVMSGYDYFASGSFPWAGLLSSAVVSAALLGGAAVNVARKDF